MARRWKKPIPPRKPWLMIRRVIEPFTADPTPYEAEDKVGRTRSITHPDLTRATTTPSLNERQIALLNRWDSRPKARPAPVRVRHSFYTIKDGAITLIRREVKTQ